jgi:Ca2+-binding RTX toxin-like protein
MRLNSDGSLDKSFIDGGIHTVFLEQNALLIDLVVQSDDKIIALIQQGYGTGTFVVRLNPDGGFDTSFNATNVAPILTLPTHINYIDTALDDSFALITGLLVAKDNSKITYNIIGGQENNDGTVSKECDYGFLTVNKTSGAYSFNPSDPNIEALLLDVSISFTITASDGLLMDSKPLIVDIVQYGKTESLGNDRLLGTSGDDLINGLAGADKMTGGFGNDIYIVDNYHDSVVENKNSGIDTVITSLSTFSLKKFSNIENLTYSGDSNATLSGNSLENILIGRSGNDRLIGGIGSDMFIISSGTDAIMDLGLGGDSLQVSLGATVNATIKSAWIASSDTLNEGTVSITTKGVAVNVSASTGSDGYSILNTGSASSLVGSAAGDSLKGGKGNDLIIGNAGNDFIYGGAGKDILTGGSGNDTFIFNTTPNKSSNIDTLTDFSSGVDKLQFDKAIFKSIGSTGTLNADAFYANAGATSGHDTTDRFVYNTTSGALYYDADGSGKNVAVQIALIGVDLVVTDFIVA